MGFILYRSHLCRARCKCRLFIGCLITLMVAGVEIGRKLTDGRAQGAGRKAKSEEMRD